MSSLVEKIEFRINDTFQKESGLPEGLKTSGTKTC